ncbi:MAG: hypothetical protein D6679_13735, partial [Candidatus Hydrogenedentota bacterium]
LSFRGALAPRNPLDRISRPVGRLAPRMSFRAPARNPLQAVSRGKGKGEKKGMGKGNQKGRGKRFLGTQICLHKGPQGAPSLGTQASCLQE